MKKISLKLGCVTLALAILGGLGWTALRLYIFNRSCHTRLSAPGKLEIVSRPIPADSKLGALVKLPRFDPASDRNLQVDLRTRDLSALDLSAHLPDLLHADFDTNTRWPTQLRPALIRRNSSISAKTPVSVYGCCTPAESMDTA